MSCCDGTVSSRKPAETSENRFPSVSVSLGEPLIEVPSYRRGRRMLIKLLSPGLLYALNQLSLGGQALVISVRPAEVLYYLKCESLHVGPFVLRRSSSLADVRVSGCWQ